MKQTGFPKDVLDQYSPENILARFVEFGGIFRHVLPLKLSFLETIRYQSAISIANCDVRKLMSSGGDIQDEHVSDFFLEMNVTRDGPERFKIYN